MTDPLKDAKPCPFCGSEDLRLAEEMLPEGYVSCRACSTEGPIAEPVAEAVRLWNQAPREAKEKP